MEWRAKKREERETERERTRESYITFLLFSRTTQLLHPIPLALSLSPPATHSAAAVAPLIKQTFPLLHSLSPSSPSLLLLPLQQLDERVSHERRRGNPLDDS